MKCPQCGSTIPDTADFCAYCGEPTPHRGTPTPLEWIRRRLGELVLTASTAVSPRLPSSLLNWIRQRIGKLLLAASTAFFLAGCGLLSCAIIVQRCQPSVTVTATGTAAEPTPEISVTTERAVTASPTSTPKRTRTPTPTRTATPSVEASPTVVESTATPICARSVATQLASAWNRGVLGCPTGQAQVVWAAWQPFERGNMFWSSDTRRVIVFYGDHTWVEFGDQWTEGAPIPSRGDPPAGLLAPIRGFGYIWGTYDTVADGIGWAIDQEKGFCANIQRFEKGIIFHGSTVRFCQDELYNWATHPDFAPLFFSAYADETWQRW